MTQRSRRGLLAAGLALSLIQLLSPLRAGAAVTYHLADGKGPIVYNPRSVVVSGNGHYLAFVAYPTSVMIGAPPPAQIYLYDRISGRRTLISANPAGRPGDGSSETPSISADGRYVAFASFANDLVSRDTNGAEDVFVWDRAKKKTSRVDLDYRGRQLLTPRFVTLAGTLPAISGDGSTIVYWSEAKDIVAHEKDNYRDPTNPNSSLDTNDPWALFGVRFSGPGRVVSKPFVVDSTVTGQVNRSFSVYSQSAISYNGRYVAFTRGYGHCLSWRDMRAAKPVEFAASCLSPAPAIFTFVTMQVFSLGISDAGDKVVFEGSGSTAGFQHSYGVYLLRPASGAITQIATDAYRPAISGNGKEIAFLMLPQTVFSYSDYPAQGSIDSTGFGTAVGDNREGYLFTADLTMPLIAPVPTPLTPPFGYTPSSAVSCGATNVPCPTGLALSPSLSKDGSVLGFITRASLTADDPDQPPSGARLAAGDPIDTEDVYLRTG